MSGCCVEYTFELAKDEIYGVVVRPSPSNARGLQVLCFTSDGFNELEGLEDANVTDDCSLRLGPALRLRELNGDAFELPDPSRPWWRDELHIRSATCEPYTDWIYFATRSAVWRLDAANTVTRVAGHRSETGDADGPGDAARLDEPWVLVADGWGALYVIANNGDRLARVQLPSLRRSSGLHVAHTDTSLHEKALLASMVSTLPTNGFMGKMTAAAFDYANRLLLIATRQFVYCLSTTAAGCLASGEIAAMLCIQTSDSSGPICLWSPKPAACTSGLSGMALTASSPGRTATSLPGLGRVSAASAGANAPNVPFFCIESILVTSSGDVYLADMADETEDAESRVQLWRFTGAAGIQPAHRKSVLSGAGAGQVSPSHEGEKGQDVGSTGAPSPPSRNSNEGGGGGAGAARAASSGIEGDGMTGGVPGSGEGRAQLVCADLGLLCTTRLSILPHGWLVAHDYEGNVLRFLRVGLAPSWPYGAELMQPFSGAGPRVGTATAAAPPPSASSATGGPAEGDTTPSRNHGRRGSRSAFTPGSLAFDLGALLAAQPDGTADVTVLVGSRRFPCHRVILAARCEYFRRLFTSGFSDSQLNEVELPDADPEAFAALLQYLYTDSADFSPGPTLRGVAELADRLLLPVACRLAQQQLLEAATPVSLVDDLLWAEELGLGQLAAALKDMFIRERTRVLMQAPGSLRRLVTEGSHDTVLELLAAAIQQAT